MIKTLRVPCELKHTRTCRQFVTELIHELGLSEEEIFKIQLAVGEASSNAIDHGAVCDEKKEVEISCTVSEKKLIISVRDWGGKSFNPSFFESLANKKSRIWREGGHGIQLIVQMMDEVIYIFHPNHTTTLCMVKYLPN